MSILLLCSAFGGLSQRVWCDLRAAGFEVRLHLDTDDALRAATLAHAPRLILALGLGRRLPADVCARVPCAVLQPGPPDDRGPNALGWALLRGETSWGVSATLNGDLCGSETFPLREASKSSLCADEVTDAAARLALQVAERGLDPSFRPTPPSAPPRLGQPDPAMPDAERHISFAGQDTETLLRVIRASDGRPGARTVLNGRTLRVFDAHRESELRARPGELRWQRGGAVLVGTQDGALWIGAASEAQQGSVKLPAASFAPNLPEHSLAPYAEVWAEHTFRDLRYVRHGAVGVVQFDFLSGALSTARSRRLLLALRHALAQDTRAVVLQGGRAAFCNGIDLNTIEASPRPACAAYASVQAMQEVSETLTTAPQLTIAALGGPAGAGGALLPLAADVVLARAGVVLNPHHRQMGLSGAALSTYHLPRRVGPETARRLTEEGLPLSAEQARPLGLLDAVLPRDWARFQAAVLDRAQDLAHGPEGEQLLRQKQARLAADFRRTPLATYRDRELAAMRRHLFEDDLGFHARRTAFVRGQPLTSTELVLA